MKKETNINALFVRYIHQAMINEKLNYINRTMKKDQKLVHDENLLNNIQYQNEQVLDSLPKEAFKSLEEYIEDDKLSKSIASLTERQKLIIFRRYVEGKKDPSIAKELGISSQAVSKQRRKAIEKLKTDFSVSL
ncbi:sigma-70 family RNA polymerase sigma factor [Enterococcus sp. AZ007]|uniref:sigma-70 family RNA polymerase sigma factor n=1 Tax=Enterococcus sp. AZ007 TaxID=2774839 RepID=UPI003F24FD3F